MTDAEAVKDLTATLKMLEEMALFLPTFGIFLSKENCQVIELIYTNINKVKVAIEGRPALINQEQKK